MEKKHNFQGIQDGETFEIAGYQFIKFSDRDGETPVVMRDYAFTSEFGKNNDLRSSTVLRRMQEEILPKVIAAVGEENLCTIKTDLTTFDGQRPYGVLESLISLPTLDFYRENGEIFNRYKPSRWCWLATPESAMPNDNPYWVLCVSPSGYHYDFSYDGDGGVRPFLIFKSSIFGSSEE